MRKLACDGVRTTTRGETQVPLVSARQEILTSLVSALDSVVRSTSLDPTELLHLSVVSHLCEHHLCSC